MVHAPFDESPTFHGFDSKPCGSNALENGIAGSNRPRAEDLLPQVSVASFIIYPTNAWFLTPVRDAAFELRNNGRTRRGVCTPQGGIWFHNVPRGSYVLAQTITTYGYDQAPEALVEVDADGRARIGDEDADGYRVMMQPTGIQIRVTDRLGQPLSGGVFALNYQCPGQNSAADLVRYARAEEGIVRFPCVHPGMYTFQEIMSPYGYHMQPRERHLLVPQSGPFRMEGYGPTEFVLTSPPLRSACVTVRVENVRGVQTALAYGLFVQYNGHKAMRAVSDLYGFMRFANIEPGMYVIKPEHSNVRPGYGARAMLRVREDGWAEICSPWDADPRMCIAEATIDDIPNPQAGEPAPRVDPVALQRDFLLFRRKFFTAVQTTEATANRAATTALSETAPQRKTRAKRRCDCYCSDDKDKDANCTGHRKKHGVEALVDEIMGKKG